MKRWLAMLVLLGGAGSAASCGRPGISGKPHFDAPTIADAAATPEQPIQLPEAHVWTSPEAGTYVDLGPDAPPPVDTCEMGPITMASGVVYAPNGVDPISGATVYTTASMPAPLGSSACEACLKGPPGAETWTNSDVNGAFSLAIPSDAQYLVIQLGRFRRIEPVAGTITLCTPNALTADQTRLPRNSTEGDIPKIAVTTGSSDRTENVLVKLGLDASAFDVYQGMTSPGSGSTPPNCAMSGLSPCTMDQLLSNLAVMQKYDIILVDCRDSYEQSLLGASFASTTSNLRAFVQGGGRLYVDDQSYEYEEATFPEVISWEPSPTPGSSVPEIDESVREGSSPIGEVGYAPYGGGTYSGTVVDSAMLSWLVARGAAPSSGAVTLTQFLGGWGVMHDIAATGSYWTSRTYVTGNVTWKSGGGEASGTRPLTVSFDYRNVEGTKCGRVLYTSYHTDSSTSTTSSTWTTQERILEYNLLNIGTCIKIIG